MSTDAEGNIEAIEKSNMEANEDFVSSLHEVQEVPSQDVEPFLQFDLSDIYDVLPFQ